jgi:hypothetical protein
MKSEKLSDTKLLRYIGKISIAYCELEDEVESGISGELHNDWDELGYLVTCKMPFVQKIDLYERLVRHHLYYCDKQANLKEFESFLNEIRSIQKFRNNVIHGIRFNEKGEIFIKQNYKNAQMFAEDEDDDDSPVRGMNSRYPKYEKIRLTEKMLNEYLKRIERVCERFGYWEEVLNEYESIKKEGRDSAGK